MSFIVKSYLVKDEESLPRVVETRDGYDITEGKFIPLEEFNGPISDPHYIEGSIEMEYRGKKILTRDTWDLVDQLWDYLLQGMEEVVKGNPYSTSFPDQPIGISMKGNSKKKQLELTISIAHPETVSIPYQDFFPAMLKEAKAFFEKMAKLVESNKSEYQQILRRLSALEKKWK